MFKVDKKTLQFLSYSPAVYMQNKMRRRIQGIYVEIA